MISLNEVKLLGNLTRDPELKYLQSGQAVCKLGIATSRSYMDKNTNQWVDVPSFHDVVVWGNAGVKIGQTMTKGNKVYISGRLESRSWTDKNNVKHYTTEIIAQDYINLSYKPAATVVADTEELPPDDLPPEVPLEDTGEAAKVAEEVDAGLSGKPVEPKKVVKKEVAKEPVPTPEDLPF